MFSKKFVPSAVSLIKLEFHDKKIKADRLAAENDLSKSAIYKVLDCKSRSPVIRAIIARAMGRKPVDIWPDYKPQRARKKNQGAESPASI